MSPNIETPSGAVSKVEVIKKALQQYNPAHYDKLPKFLKHRVNALKKLQLDRIQLDQQYHNELQELEIKYAKLYEPFNQKRFDIISGKHEPTDDECVLPANVLDYDLDGDQEDKMKEDEAPDAELYPTLTEEEEQEAKTKLTGVPYYWLGILNSSLSFIEAIEEHDKPVLRYLNDIRVKYEKEGLDVTYILEFHFDQNPYFNKPILTKKYFLRSEPDEKDPFCYEGHEVIKSEGCAIDWNEGKDPTVKTMNVRQKHKTKGTVRTKSKSVDQESFFHFFNPPEIPENREEMDEETSTLASIDFELGETIRQSLIPRAVLYYTGYLLEDDDDDDDDMDDEDLDGLSDEDESSDESGSDSDSLDAKEGGPKKGQTKTHDAKNAKANSRPPECKHH